MIMAEELRLLKSHPNNERVFIRFYNLTQKSVDIVWIDFSGTYIRYHVLQHGQFIDINTYKQHPWIAFDYETKDRLHLNGKFIYFPKTIREYIEEMNAGQRRIPANIRIRVNITLPLYSLKFRCLLAVRDCLIRDEDCDCLELPNSLKAELRNVVKFKSNVPRILPHLIR